MRTARPLYQPRTKSIEQQKLELDRSKHVHQILQPREARFGQILTWLFTSQGLLGAAYAYLKSQVAASQALNRMESFKAARGLLQAFPYFASLPAGHPFDSVVSCSGEPAVSASTRVRSVLSHAPARRSLAGGSRSHRWPVHLRLARSAANATERLSLRTQPATAGFASLRRRVNSNVSPHLATWLRHAYAVHTMHA